MPIEFRCSQCNQLLRVPDDSAGKHARCPKCQALMMVPAAVVGAGVAPLPPAVPPPADSPIGYPNQGIGGAVPPQPPPPNNPFGEAAASPFGSGVYSPGTNPYASPAGAVLHQPVMPLQPVPINPRPVPAEAILNYAWEIWKNNLVLLVVTTLVFFVIAYAIQIPFGVMQVVFAQRGEQEASVAAQLLGSVVTQLVQIFLTIGQSQISLKLARRQPANFADLFGGLPIMLPLIGAYLLAVIPAFFGVLLLIVPFILMLLAFWPFYYLIVDRKTGVVESFSVAYQITRGNWGNSFLLWLLSVGISILGCLALCVGILFAMPLVNVMWAVAYLMMSGQLAPQPAYGKYAP